MEEVKEYTSLFVLFKLTDKAKIKFIIFGCLMLLSIVFSLPILISMTMVLKNREISHEPFQSNTYQYLEYNRLKNETTSTGLVTIPDYLEEEDNIFRDDGDLMSLVSNFGKEEYRCTGSCYCDNDRRNIGVVLSRSLMFLVASATSLLAYDKARKYFEEACFVEHHMECPETSISTIVEGCEMVYENAYLDELKDERRYFCRGNCIPKKLIRGSMKEMSENFGCENLQFEANVDVDCTNRSDCHLYGRKQFSKRHLSPFCKMNSKTRYLYIHPNSIDKRDWRSIYLCVGTSGKTNPTVSCRQVRPFPSH